MRLFVLIFTVSMAIACSGSTNQNQNNAANKTPAKAGPAPVYGYEIVNTYPHDPKAFTEGLFYHDGYLYESTGQSNGGFSSLRKVELTTGKVLQQ